MDIIEIIKKSPGGKVVIETIPILNDPVRVVSTFFTISKCVVIILVVYRFLNIATMRANHEEFDLWILNTVGFWVLLFLGVLTIERAGEKGDKYIQQS